MKRDLDLVREIMLALETNDDLNGRSRRRYYVGQLLPFPNRNQDELAYHLMLILDEGWIDGQYNRTSGDFEVNRLTANGHDFVDSTRSPDVWQKARFAMKAGGTETLKFAWDIAKAIARKKVEQHLPEGF